jgi:hypothetical protein
MMAVLTWLMVVGQHSLVQDSDLEGAFNDINRKPKIWENPETFN